MRLSFMIVCMPLNIHKSYPYGTWPTREPPTPLYRPLSRKGLACSICILVLMVSTGYIPKMETLRATAAAIRCRLASRIVCTKTPMGPATFTPPPRLATMMGEPPQRHNMPIKSSKMRPISIIPDLARRQGDFIVDDCYCTAKEMTRKRHGKFVSR